MTISLIMLIFYIISMFVAATIWKNNVKFLNSRIDYWHQKYIHMLFLNQELLEKNNRVEGDEWKDLL